MKKCSIFAEGQQVHYDEFSIRVFGLTADARIVPDNNGDVFTVWEDLKGNETFSVLVQGEFPYKDIIGGIPRNRTKKLCTFINSLTTEDLQEYFGTVEIKKGLVMKGIRLFETFCFTKHPGFHTYKIFGDDKEEHELFYSIKGGKYVSEDGNEFFVPKDSLSDVYIKGINIPIYRKVVVHMKGFPKPYMWYDHTKYIDKNMMSNCDIIHEIPENLIMDSTANENEFEQ